ncbi:MAG TPA: 2-oxoglutarate dehydrogenase complex dihydrolipoyllysine-residue succinyltransferase [Phycisphaerales bacterium]|nr:2-oxoglutarate dehydrogenase complex dihydrolipoyllysine-residue succinyltransferase [Phycisphaerales bacterium]HIB01292.1 2-oxoglutarate dehydrogenase complex dihydrolipoyllysine-residue succinyltransferase [Phycisphaerales bacterium]HIB50049.1 2-oxoglutarate dehydrogenase complex dihydrolipoyllysine-residue succinyltransferase [Phycisphaerales bacterium]HIO19483.1 2-oxoglutarate dehydrogenase complex dihydrolipoyllysine-residue succinyltransferase [Phycisphaerales bacterium]HIO53312.1 2-ox
MSTPITIPSLGESINEVVLGQWLVKDGQWVERDSPLLEIESDKVTQELPSPVSGLLKIEKQTGEDCLIGDIIGSVDESATKPESIDAGIDETAVEEVKTETIASAQQTRKATPLAQKVASDLGVSLETIEGSGPSGRITKSDVLGAEDSSTVHDHAPLVEQPAPQHRGVRREKMSTLRKKIAERLVEAQHNAAMLTTFNEADMTKVIALRKLHKDEFNDRYGVNLGFMSFFTKACVSALRTWPAVNASLVEGDVEYHDYVDMSVAVGTDRGLVVPVIRSADRMSFAEVELTIKDLALKARDGKLTIADMTGGTFTISNGGVYGSMMSTPILNPPQSGILGLHRIQNRPIEDPNNDGQIVLRPMMYLALSYDHRLVDGEGAVRFLVHVKNCIEDPERLLLGL